MQTNGRVRSESMVGVYETILERVIGHVRAAKNPAASIAAHDELGELGVDSMEIITILIALEQEFGLDFTCIADAVPPKTIQDLAGIAATALRPDLPVGTAGSATPGPAVQ